MSHPRSAGSLALHASSRRFAALVSVAALGTVLGTIAAPAAWSQAPTPLSPGNLLVSRSRYVNNHAVRIGDILPPGCTGTTAGCATGSGAVANSAYPRVFNNDTYDSSFGVTSPIYLDQITTKGQLVSTIEVPNSTQAAVTSTSDQMVTSFSSKSELALHLSTDSNSVSFMGYVAPVSALDVSNSNTARAVDPTNPVGESYYRAVADLNKQGHFNFTETNAYSGNNGRSAIFNVALQAFYTAGNAGNGGNPQPAGIVTGAGAQFIQHATSSEYTQNPQEPRPVGSFSVTELGDKADKLGKDDNFRGIAIYNNVLYFTKGSGSNGVNTVYFVDTVGTACPSGVGLPVSGATLPAHPISYDPATVATTGLTSNMCILQGFPTALAKKANPLANPFGLWFANATTLYVADEGDGYSGGSDLYTHAAAQPSAGLQKWVFDAGSQSWKLVYTLQRGLELGFAYPLAAYPTGINAATGLDWRPAADGLRNITGMVGDGSKVPVGKVVLYGVTSTVSGSGDQGADPNKLMYIVDDIANTDPTVAAKEDFHTLRYAQTGNVLRGVSFTPGTANISSF
jgi:hypothetical protein